MDGPHAGVKTTLAIEMCLPGLPIPSGSPTFSQKYCSPLSRSRCDHALADRQEGGPYKCSQESVFYEPRGRKFFNIVNQADSLRWPSMPCLRQVNCATTKKSALRYGAVTKGSSTKLAWSGEW